MTPQTIHSPHFSNGLAAWPTIPLEDHAEGVLAAKLLRAQFELRDREESDRVLKAFDRFQRL
jgi:hypothetical protein